MTSPSTLSRLRGCLLGCALGDAIGFRNGSFEFNPDTLGMHKVVSQTHPQHKKSVEHLNLHKWRVSDDTVMHLATVDALLEVAGKEQGTGKLAERVKQGETVELRMSAEAFAKHFILCWKDMEGRAAGGTCRDGVFFLERNGVENWQKYPYSKYGGGCGGSMRAMGIGLRYFSKSVQRNEQQTPSQSDESSQALHEHLRRLLVSVSIESGRLTHNHPTGFLGAMTSAAFTALAMEGQVPIEQWPHVLLNDLIPRAKVYLEECNRDWDKIKVDINKFVSQWEEYMRDRCMLPRHHADETTGNNEQNGEDKGCMSDENDEDGECVKSDVLPLNYPENMEDPLVRDQYYRKFSYSGWFGASGDDSVIVAYDCLLESKGDFDKLVFWSCLNAGDCDSIGAIALAWFGALHGEDKFYRQNLQNLEKREQLEKQAQDLYDVLKNDSRIEL